MRNFLNIVASRRYISCVKVSWGNFVALVVVSTQPNLISGRNFAQKLSVWINPSVGV